MGSRREGITQPLRKEVDRMPKYLVRVYEPTVYEIEAGSEEEAVREAVKRYKKEEDIWIDPEVQVAEIT
jgi:hypothetical protein